MRSCAAWSALQCTALLRAEQDGDMQGGGVAHHQAAHLLSSLPCGVVWKNDMGAAATLASSLSCMLTPARMPPYANENALACTQASMGKPQGALECRQPG